MVLASRNRMVLPSSVRTKFYNNWFGWISLKSENLRFRFTQFKVRKGPESRVWVWLLSIKPGMSSENPTNLILTYNITGAIGWRAHSYLQWRLQT